MSTPPIIPIQETPKARHPMAEAWEMFRGNHAAMVALVVLTLIIITAIIGPYIYSTDPFDMVWAPFSPPGVDGFLLGTDYLGRDLMAALIHGARVSIVIGVAAAFMSVFIGVTVGALVDADHRVFPSPANAAICYGDRCPVRCIANNDHICNRSRKLDRRGAHYTFGIFANTRIRICHCIACIGGEKW
jgi:hypothetical protein